MCCASFKAFNRQETDEFDWYKYTFFKSLFIASLSFVSDKTYWVINSSEKDLLTKHNTFFRQNIFDCIPNKNPYVRIYWQHGYSV